MSAILKEKADFATQAGHWYELDGTPRYTIIGKNGKERNTTVRDAREHKLVPSVTTILRLAAAPGLDLWKREQVAKAAYWNEPLEGEDEAHFIARVLPISEELAKKARNKGTEIHGAIERMDRHGEYADHVEVALTTVGTWFNNRDWDSERSFASPLGYGGKLDLSAPGIVVDFKTTEKDLDGLKTWPDHRRQLAAYRMGLDMPEARCAICYVSSTEPKARLIELTQEELGQGWEEFKALLAFWKAVNKFQ